MLSEYWRVARPDTLRERAASTRSLSEDARGIRDANEALKLLDEDVADPVWPELGAAAKACDIVRDERFRDDLDLDEATCEIGRAACRLRRRASCESSRRRRRPGAG